MYENFFDLSSRPFPAAPVVQYFFPTPVIEQARQTLIRIVDRAEGPGLIIGQPGLGKTLLLRMLDHHFQNVFHCIHLASAAIESRKDLLQNVLFELNLPYRDMEEGELRLSLLDFLRPSESCPHGVLLLVDEAHTLPLQLLDEIRMITNLVRDGQPRVRLVLAGDTQLDDVFADPRLDSFNQRIAARCYLEPLNQEQTVEYVQAQIAMIGGQPSEIFTPDALVAVYRASAGIPRLINQVCDHSLVMASLGGYHQLDAAGIEEAWADLQQLPGPWNDTAGQSNNEGESIVEFGSLDEIDATTTGPNYEPVESNDASHELETEEAAGPHDATIPLPETSNSEFEAIPGEIHALEIESPEVQPGTDTSWASVDQAGSNIVAPSDAEIADSWPDPANGTPVVANPPQAVNTNKMESPETAPQIESQETESQVAEPLETESTQTSPAFEAAILETPPPQSPGSDPFDHELATFGQSNPELLPEEMGIDYYEANVVQVGWETSAFDAIAVDSTESNSPGPDNATLDGATLDSSTLDNALGHEADPELPPAGTAIEATDNITPETETPDGSGQPTAVAPNAANPPRPVAPAATNAQPADFVDPFGQGFEEEEVVIDRYADLTGGIFAGRPRVASEEGRALAAIIDQQAGPQLSVVDVEHLGNEASDNVLEQPAAAPEGPEVMKSDESSEPIAEAQDAITSELGTDDELAAEELANNVFDTSSLSEWLFESPTETVVAIGADTENAWQAAKRFAPSEDSAVLSENSANASTSDTTTNATHAVTPSLSKDEPEAEPSFLQVHDGPTFTDDRDMIVIDEDNNDGVFLTQSSDDLARRVEYQQLFSQLRDG